LNHKWLGGTVHPRRLNRAVDDVVQVRNGDRIRLSVKNRKICLLVSDDELPNRMRANPVTEPTAERGYLKLFLQEVTQADKGVDFEFLRSPKILGAVPK
jgi:dihydroxy-acid dehydratase